MTEASADVIDHLVGIEPGSPLDAIRARRPQARQNAQTSFRALFQPDEAGPLAPAERFALATFVATLHCEPDIAQFYARQLTGCTTEAVAAAVAAAAAAGKAHGPYGSYPSGPLSDEDRPGPVYQVAQAHCAVLGAKLSAGFAHAHLLVFHPRDAGPSALQALLDTGWTTTGIVTLSQLVAFLSFQIRVVAGLRALRASIERGGR